MDTWYTDKGCNQWLQKLIAQNSCFEPKIGQNGGIPPLARALDFLLFWAIRQKGVKKGGQNQGDGFCKIKHGAGPGFYPPTKVPLFSVYIPFGVDTELRI